MSTLGEKISPILVEIENTLWEHEALFETQMFFTDEGFRAGVKIFATVVLDKMYDLQVREKMTPAQKIKMCTHCGEAINKLVKEMTGINTKELYDKT